MASEQADFDGMWQALHPIGRDPNTGGYQRLAWTAADRMCREWFEAEAHRRGLATHVDRNGNLWAWHGDPDQQGPGIVTGSHLDSVRDGGAYDGPLGIVSAFAAFDRLVARTVDSGHSHGRSGVPTANRPWEPPTSHEDLVPPTMASRGRGKHNTKRPLGIVAFADEEGARFGIPCVGSRLLTGALDPDRIRSLTDTEGISYDEAMRAAGHDPTQLGRDDETRKRIGVFVELHIEQGKGLADHNHDHPVGLADGIWPHGRWRFDFAGRPDHAGTTRMEDRADPMLTYAMTALAANKRARLSGTRATFGRVEIEPNGCNAIPSKVTGWLDARAQDDETLQDLLETVERQSRERAVRDGTTLETTTESRTPKVTFDSELLARLGRVLDHPPVIGTAAGHDAGILASAGIPTAMLFVRNRTGISHAPDEFAERDDCLAGVEALTKVLAELL